MKQPEGIQDRQNPNVRGIGQGKIMRRKYKRFKLGCGQAYDRSNEFCHLTVVTYSKLRHNSLYSPATTEDLVRITHIVVNMVCTYSYTDAV
jgi:hypothetical protein